MSEYIMKKNTAEWGKPLTLDRDALIYFGGYVLWAAGSVRIGSFDEWLKNYPALVLILSGILHCAAYLGAGSEPPQDINRMTMSAAMMPGEYYFDTAIRTFCADNPQIDPDAEYVLGKLRENGTEKINRRDLLHLCRKFHSVAALNSAVGVLERYGWLRSEETPYRGYGRKPSPTYTVNPKLFARD